MPTPRLVAVEQGGGGPGADLRLPDQRTAAATDFRFVNQRLQRRPELLEPGVDHLVFLDADSPEHRKAAEDQRGHGGAGGIDSQPSEQRPAEATALGRSVSSGASDVATLRSGSPLSDVSMMRRSCIVCSPKRQFARMSCHRARFETQPAVRSACRSAAPGSPGPRSGGGNARRSMRWTATSAANTAAARSRRWYWARAVRWTPIRR